MRTVSNSFKDSKNARVLQPVYLYGIRYDSVSNSWLYYTSDVSDVTFDGTTYTSMAIKHSTLNENLEGRVQTMQLYIGNADRQIQSYLNQYNGLKGCLIMIRLAWRNKLGDVACYDEYELYILDATANAREVAFTIGPKFGTLNINVPRRAFIRNRCKFKYKGEECGATSILSSCNHTKQDCIDRGNLERFGGFISIPDKAVWIKGSD